MWIYIVIAIILLIIIYAFILYNGFVKFDNKVNEAFATMDVYLKKRWDLIPNIVKTVEGYAKHEKDTLENVIKLRNNTYDNMSNEDKIKTNEQLSNDIDKIMMLGEAYPDLKASDNFQDLSNQLTKVEDEIANSRKYYNAVIRIYNNKVQIIPNNLFAYLFGYKSKKMFRANDSEREAIKIEL